MKPEINDGNFHLYPEECARHLLKIFERVIRDSPGFIAQRIGLTSFNYDVAESERRRTVIALKTLGYIEAAEKLTGACTYDGPPW